MSELTGTDAFEHVVGALIDQAGRSKEEIEKRLFAEAQLRGAQTEIRELNGKLADLLGEQRNWKRQRELASRLWVEADKAAEGPWDDEQLAKLRNIINESKKDFDPMPF